MRWHARDLERQYGIDVDWEVLHGDPVTSITNHLEGRRDVLMVMATRGQPTLQAAVLGSVTSGLLQHAGVPIVVQAPVKAKQHLRLDHRGTASATQPTADQIAAQPPSLARIAPDTLRESSLSSQVIAAASCSAVATDGTFTCRYGPSRSPAN